MCGLRISLFLRVRVAISLLVEIRGDSKCSPQNLGSRSVDALAQVLWKKTLLTRHGWERNLAKGWDDVYPRKRACAEVDGAPKGFPLCTCCCADRMQLLFPCPYPTICYYFSHSRFSASFWWPDSEVEWEETVVFHHLRLRLKDLNWCKPLEKELWLPRIRGFRLNLTCWLSPGK